MLESERKVFEKMDGKSPMSKYWMPLVWATNIINRARKEGLISSDHIVQTLLVELSDIRRRLERSSATTPCVRLWYTLRQFRLRPAQSRSIGTTVVTLALYMYFVAALMGRQLVPPAPGSTSKYEPDVYFPFFTALQVGTISCIQAITSMRFCFYVGWLKVAEVLINPFGEDDDDIELNWLIDRHIKAAYMIVDEMHEEHPELLRDQYWEEVVPKDLPYTVASEHYRRHEPPCSADHYKVKAEDAVYANLRPARVTMKLTPTMSASTAYSSGGLFGRNRHNSVVYSSPESGQPAPPPAPPHKMSLYERLVGRKSGRGQHRQNSRHGGQKVNGSAVPVTLRNRPRLPTPDTTKEIIERDGRVSSIGMQQSGAMGVTLMTHQSYPNEVPVLGALVLSPIQELDSGSVNNTLHAGQPGTAALAQAVLSPALTSAGIAPVLGGSPVVSPMTFTPMSVSQLSTLCVAAGTSVPSTPRNDRASTPLQGRATLTELTGVTTDKDSEHSSLGGGTGSGSAASVTDALATADRNRKISSGSKRGEVYV
ncbi:Bestrophin-3 [Eumeta japonica]|uniref:Bestrophin homolog n=1 Tax=Eumeta variegata TaxID=151549 RepID=A0A4C2AF74_EUMVA|nr:Bestrophin-3 [Eumeta japonica]